MKKKLIIAMVGLPARGKSTMACKIASTLERDEVKVKIFNNGELRRELSKDNTSSPEFFSPDNKDGVLFREQCAKINLERALAFLDNDGEVAIIDAGNVTRERRRLIRQAFTNFPIFHIECVNIDEEANEAYLERKASLKEFSHLSQTDAFDSFFKRISYYESIYEPPMEERNRILVDSFEGHILQQHITESVPFYDRIRDLITTRVIKNLFLVRHGETHFNTQDRIGGDSDLTEKGMTQARTLAEYFSSIHIPIIFTSNHKRTHQTAAPIAAKQKDCSVIALTEFNEIHAGICEGMTYQEIREQKPEVAKARNRNKYGYVYPEGEGYASMEKRIHRGLQKVFYLNNYNENIMIVGHRAVNRMILSDFVFRQKEEVPYIYMPQNRYYHIQIDTHKKHFEIKSFAPSASLIT